MSKNSPLATKITNFQHPKFLFMQKILLRTLVLIFLSTSIISCKKNKEAEQSTAEKSKTDTSIDDIISKMTLEEKVGQMTNLTLATIAAEEGDTLIADPVKIEDVIVKHHIGSLQNVINHGYSLALWHELINGLQKVTLEKTRMKIPFLYCIDAVHGTNYTLGSTIFPHNLNLASTRNPELVRQAAAITAAEARASGIRYNFSPVLDVGRNAQWSRFPETFGEDVEIVRIMGTASIKGYEGKSLADPSSVASCMKHYIGYSVPGNGKDRAPAYIPEIVLREYFLPPFEEAIKAGASTLMVNSGDVNGTPVHASKYLLTDVLRNELGFKGVVISDWQDILKLTERHRVAANHKEAVKLAVDAGIDMCIVPFDFRFYDDLIALVKEGRISEERINKSVRRILALKKNLNLFDKPYVEEAAVANFGKPEYKTVAETAAKESIVLLKNENGVLPLDTTKRIVVLGPSANSLTALHGAWTYTWQGRKSDYFAKDTETILQSLINKYGAANISYLRGANYDDSLLVKKSELDRMASKADAIVICAGEESFAETPGNVSELELPDVQKELIRMASATGKPVILVLTEGRPRVIRKVEPLCQAIVYAGWPGSQGGPAIAAILSGDYNPNGKLAFTYPRYNGELLTYDHKTLDEAVEIVEPEYDYHFSFNPQYPFGHGQSYTNFTYSDFRINTDTLRGNDTLQVNVTIKNTGNRDGKEVVELYVRDAFATVVPPVKRLKAFEKINLKTGESKTVRFTLTKEQLSFIGADLKRVVEDGDFDVMVKDQKASFYLMSK